MMRAHWQYLKYLLQHKWFVLLEGLKLGTPLWLGLVHDWSKFLPNEWMGYVRHFYGGPYPSLVEVLRRLPAYGGPTKESVEAGFDLVWLAHQHRNKHHWQYWLLVEDEPERAIEAQAALEHKQWAHWVNHMLDHITPTNVLRWRHQTNTAYVDLTDAEKEKDRQWAVKTLGAGLLCLPMPDKYRREMLADWRGARRAVGKPDTAAWYVEHCAHIRLHPATREWVERELGVEPNECWSGV